MRQEIPGPIDPFLGTGEEMCDRENGVTSDVYASQPGVQGAQIATPHPDHLAMRAGAFPKPSWHGVGIADVEVRADGRVFHGDRGAKGPDLGYEPETPVPTNVHNENDAAQSIDYGGQQSGAAFAQHQDGDRLAKQARFQQERRSDTSPPAYVYRGAKGFYGGDPSGDGFIP
jgi:hypothetical protein